jgi:hypothetical protein
MGTALPCYLFVFLDIFEIIVCHILHTEYLSIYIYIYILFKKMCPRTRVPASGIRLGSARDMWGTYRKI